MDSAADPSSSSQARFTTPPPFQSQQDSYRAPSAQDHHEKDSSATNNEANSAFPGISDQTLPNRENNEDGNAPANDGIAPHGGDMNGGSNGAGNGGDAGAGAAPAGPAPAVDYLEIKVKDSNNNETHFRVKPITLFDKIFKAYAQKEGKDVKTLRFFRDGIRIRAEQTPQECEMEDGDVLDVMIEQIGGAA